MSCCLRNKVQLSDSPMSRRDFVLIKALNKTHRISVTERFYWAAALGRIITMTFTLRPDPPHQLGSSVFLLDSIWGS